MKLPVLTKLPLRKKLVAIIGLIVLALILSLGYVLSGPNGKDNLREYRVEKGNIETSILATGEVRPENRLEVKVPVEGRIDEVLVKEGAEVTAGQVLAWMSSKERAALLDAARAKGESEVKHWQELYRPIPVVSPINGTIIYRNVEAGQSFGTGAGIFAMSDQLLVKAQVDETDLAQIHLNQQARVVLDAYPQEPLMGRVHKISFESKVVNNVTTYVVDVKTNRVPDFMRSGMTVNVSFIADSRTDVLLIPTEALTYKGGENYVRIKGEDKANRKVEIGITDGKHTEILSGLQVGEIVMAPKLPGKKLL